ncbi:MAG: CaiB/BaiF CoA transferase family protein [Candidatus Bathyarchaeia archaeon]
MRSIVVLIQLVAILDDVRVIDLTQFYFGPFATKLLADLGAEVIRVEPPWGGTDRLADGAIFGGSSYSFHHWNVNKKGITLNLKTDEGNRIFRELVEISDVVVQNFRPGTMERLRLGYEVLKTVNPNIIYAALSGFGQTGPYRNRPSFAMIAEAMSGHTRLTGDKVDPEGPPIEMAQAYGDLGPALYAALCIVAALRHRDGTGEGQSIDVAQMDCMVSLVPALTGYSLSGLRLWEIREKYPMARGFGGLFQARDGGWIRIASFSPRIIEELKENLGVEEVTISLLEGKTSKMERDEAVDFYVEAGIPAAPVYSEPEVLEDPQLRSRDMWVTLDHSKAGEVKVPNFPVKLSKTPAKIKTPAPTIGQHTKQVLENLLEYTKKEVEYLEEVGVLTT